MTSTTSALVSTAWLADNLQRSDLRIVDVTFFLPGTNRNAREEFLQGHIPGALFLDMDSICEPGSPLPNTMPSAAHFGAAMGALGIANQDLVVVYDAHGIMSAPRVWWMLRAFGHQRVAVLDGGLPKWKREQRALESGASVRAPASFSAREPGAVVRSLAQMEQAVQAGRQIADARAAARFQGTEPEPRPGLRSGHIPGSRNLPYGNLLDPEHGTFLDAGRLAEKFAQAGIDIEQPVICSCGSGVSACVLALGLHELGKHDATIYDGSWTEWGSDPELPIETGPHQ